MSTDDTRRILDLLAQGKVTVDEADQLLKAVGAATAPGPVGDAPAGDAGVPRPRWIRINVRKPANENRKAKDVNIRVPVAVMKGGIRLGAIIASFAGEKAAQRMRERGMDLDLAKISGDLSKMNGPEFDQFLKTLDDVNIEVDDGKAQVRITCE
jgi:hypothetical protein